MLAPILEPKQLTTSLNGSRKNSWGLKIAIACDVLVMDAVSFSKSSWRTSGLQESQERFPNLYYFKGGERLVSNYGGAPKNKQNNKKTNWKQGKHRKTQVGHPHSLKGWGVPAIT